MKHLKAISQTESLCSTCQRDIVLPALAVLCRHLRVYSRREKHLDEFDSHPPAGAAEPHLHKGYETAIYLLKGGAKTRYGRRLEQSIICQEGDFILIRPDVPHQPINLSTMEPALAIVAYNDPNEQESVVHYGGQAQTENRLKLD